MRHRIQRRCGAAFGAALALLVFARGAPAEELGVDCLIEPQARARLSPAVEGVVASVDVERGDRVEQGQLVATLESSLEEAAVAMAEQRARAEGRLERARARAEYERLRLARSERLFARDTLSEQELDEARSASRSAEAELTAAREEQELSELELVRARADLERRRVRSPIDGVVVDRLLEPGEYSESDEILEIARIDPLHVEAYVPAAWFGRIAVGARARITLEGDSERSGPGHDARVTIVDPVLDPASRSFGVRLELANREGVIPAGLGCQVHFALEDAPGPSPAPASAAPTSARPEGASAAGAGLAQAASVADSTGDPSRGRRSKGSHSNGSQLGDLP